MSRPLVSVVIPTYNAPQLLVETIHSVLAQTFSEYEIIVVNDGSTDDTLQRLAPFGDRVRVIDQPNAGIGAARNRGIEAARGKYVAPLDHDDLWLPQKLATQVEFLESRPQCVACVVPFARTTSPARVAFDRAALADAAGIVHNPVDWLVRGAYFVLTCALMFDRERAAQARYATRRDAIEDIPFHLQLFGAGAFGVAGDRVLALHRDHAGNFSRRPSYYFWGQRQLRELDRSGAFAAVRRSEPAALTRYLAALGRTATVWQFDHARRWRGAQLYLGELPHQLRLGRWRFLLGAPLMAAWPRSSLKRRGPL